MYIIGTPYVLATFDEPNAVFLFFGAVLLIFFIINVTQLIETKGLTPKEIYHQFF
jgi:hypothetical protein